MKKALLVLIVCAPLCAQVQLGRNVQIGGTSNGTTFEQQVIPPIAGQYVVVYPTAGTIASDPTGGSVIGATGGKFNWLCNGILCNIAPTMNASWTGFALPSYVDPANVTAIYADAVNSGSILNTVMPGGGSNTSQLSCTGMPGTTTLFPSFGTPSTPWALKEYTQLTTLTGSTLGAASCNLHLGASALDHSGMTVDLPAIRLLVYYIGPPPPARTAIDVVAPLSFNIAALTLSDDAIDTAAGVVSINSTTGAFTFTGDGVSCSGTTCTFTGGGGGGTPGGFTSQIQYNNVGVFGGDSGFTTDGAGHVTLKSASIADGTGAAGLVALKQGTPPSTAANSIGFTAPTSVTAYNMKFPAAQWTGCLSNDGSGNLSGTTCSAASGSVTSVAQTVPAWLTVSGSPVTATGTLAITAATGQTAHRVLGTCGTATSFSPCALVQGDLPAQPAQLSSTFLGVPANSQVFFYAPQTIALTVPASCSGSFATATVAATGSTAILFKDLTTSTTLCTATFAASGTTATFSGTGGSVSAGDVLQIIGPATADATLANLGVSIYATR